MEMLLDVVMAVSLVSMVVVLGALLVAIKIGFSEAIKGIAAIHDELKRD